MLQLLLKKWSFVDFRHLCPR